MPRTEFGVQRSTCSCHECATNCRHMPGCLIPSDLDRMIPPHVRDVFGWAEDNLLASPGALVRNTVTGQVFRIKTLVPAVKADGSCIHLTESSLCAIHAAAPFGCAFFDCTLDPRHDTLSVAGMREVQHAHRTNALYSCIWHHLNSKGFRQHPPEVLRARMSANCQEER